MQTRYLTSVSHSTLDTLGRRGWKYPLEERGRDRLRAEAGEIVTKARDHIAAHPAKVVKAGAATRRIVSCVLMAGTNARP